MMTTRHQKPAIRTKKEPDNLGWIEVVNRDGEICVINEADYGAIFCFRAGISALLRSKETQ
jgi:hypothetical protein